MEYWGSLRNCCCRTEAEINDDIESLCVYARMYAVSVSVSVCADGKMAGDEETSWKRVLGGRTADKMWDCQCTDLMEIHSCRFEAKGCTDAAFPLPLSFFRYIV